MTGPQLSAAAAISQSVISRLETGKTTSKVADIERLLTALTAPDADRKQLLDVASNLGTDLTPWQLIQRGGLLRGQQSIMELERTTTEIRVLQTTLVPGQLQTPAYARAIMAMASGHDPAEIDDAVALRLQRQTILYDPRRRFSFVMMEALLHPGLVPAEVMAEQIDRLLSVRRIPQVSLGVIPLGAPLTSAPICSFLLHDNRAVYLETLSTEVMLTAPRDVAIHRASFDQLEAVAVRGPELEQLLSRLA